MKYNLVIFDMDGTILDTLNDLKNSLNYCLKKYNFNERSLEEVRSFVGNGIRRLIELSIPNINSSIIDEIYKIFIDYYDKHCNDTTKVYEGIIDTIKELKKQNVLTAVVSNKADLVVQKLCSIYFEGLFDYQIGMQNGIRKKPFPDSVIKVMESLNVDKEHTIYVGDSEVDVETSKNANIKCISVDWGFRKRDYLEKLNNYKVISNPKEILEIIK